MKTLTESIIGRRSSTKVLKVPRLKHHDIVILDNGRYYVVIMDEKEIKLLSLDLDLSNYQTTEGILIRFAPDYRMFDCRPLNEFDSDLKITKPYKTINSAIGQYDINTIYRSSIASTTRYQDNPYKWCDEMDLKKKVSHGYEGYKLIWER